MSTHLFYSLCSISFSSPPLFFVDMVSLCYTVWSKTHRDPPNSVFWVLGFIDWFFYLFLTHFSMGFSFGSLYHSVFLLQEAFLSLIHTVKHLHFCGISGFCILFPFEISSLLAFLFCPYTPSSFSIGVVFCAAS